MQQLETRKSRPAHSPLETYLREINETALLTAREEHELAGRVEEGDCEARDQMVRANLRLVVNIARSYLGRGLALEDLIAEGNLGLMRAVEGFDPSLDIRFSTYASYWIKQSIKRAVINTGKTVRVPAYMAELMVKWRREANRLQEELGRAPTQDEVAAGLKLSRKKFAIIKKALSIYNAGVHTDSTDTGWSLNELLLDDHTHRPDKQLMATDDLSHVLQHLNRMEPREATVLRMRFGLGEDHPRTLKEIGESLGLTRERVRQIERDALLKLREALLEE
jgi:RNA polymerase primary sigma factor